MAELTVARRRTWPRLDRLPRDLQVLLVIGIVALLLRLWPIAGLATDYDEGVYWQSLRALAAGHALFVPTFSSQPPFFLLSLYPFYLLFGQTLGAARLGVAVYSLVGLGAAYYAGRTIGGRWAGVLAAALLTADPLYLEASHRLQAEAPALAFALVGIALAAAATQRAGRPRWVLAALAGVALGLGIMTKLFDIVALLPAALYLAEPASETTVGADGRLRLPPRADLLAGLRAAAPDLALLLGGVVLACALVLLPYVPHWTTLYDQVVRFHLVAARTSNRGLRYNLLLLAQSSAAYPLALVAAATLVLAARRRDRLAWLVLPPALWLALAALVLVRQQPLFDHHRVLLTPPLVLIAAQIGVLTTRSRAAAKTIPQVAWLARGLVLLSLALGIVIGTLQARQDAQSVPASQAHIATTLRAETLPSDLIVSDDQYVVGLADRSVVPELVDTSLVRIDSGYLTSGQLEALITQRDVRVVLFASGRFEHLPGFRAWVDAHFTPFADFGNGRMLYLKLAKRPPLA